MSTHSHEGPECCKSPKPGRKITWWVVGGSLFLGGIALFIPPLRSFGTAFWEYIRLVGWAVLVGLGVGGVIDRFVPKEYISKILAQPKKRTVFYATGLGILASTCSHGILALSMEIHRKGASGPAVISFLLASPWANFPVTLLLFGLFGWKGFLIIVMAACVALTTGLVFQGLDQKGWIEKNPHTAHLEESFSFSEDFKNRIRSYRPSFSQFKADLIAVVQGTLELSEMVLGWVMFGILLASLIQAYVPTHFFHAYLGPSLPGLLATLFFATIIEVCSEGTAPLAFEIYRQTQAIGNSFVFLSAGVITDYTEIGLVWSNLGRRTALWMVGLGVPQILFWGFLLNRLF